MVNYTLKAGGDGPLHTDLHDCWLHGLKLNFLPMSPLVLLEVREGISIDIIQQSCLSPAAPLEQRETLH